jgi:hypothetical protein
MIAAVRGAATHAAVTAVTRSESAGAADRPGGDSIGLSRSVTSLRYV